MKKLSLIVVWYDGTCSRCLTQDGDIRRWVVQATSCAEARALVEKRVGTATDGAKRLVRPNRKWRMVEMPRYWEGE